MNKQETHPTGRGSLETWQVLLGGGWETVTQPRWAEEGVSHHRRGCSHVLSTALNIQYCTEHSVLQTGQPCCLSDTRRAQRTFLPFATAWTRTTDVLFPPVGTTPPPPFLYQRTNYRLALETQLRPSIFPGRPLSPHQTPRPELCSLESLVL